MLLLTFCYYCLQFREIEHKILEKFDDDEVDVVCSLLYIYLLKRSNFCFNEINSQLFIVWKSWKLKYVNLGH